MRKKNIGKFLTGAAIGAGIALLFAPKKGSETRKDLKKKSDEVIDKIKHTDAKDIKNALNKKLTELKKDFENLDKETVKEVIKEKADLLIDKADELIEMAKEKSAPVIEKTTKEIKNKTIDILNAAVDKLEDKPKTSDKKNSKNTNKKKA